MNEKTALSSAPCCGPVTPSSSVVSSASSSASSLSASLPLPPQNPLSWLLGNPPPSSSSATSRSKLHCSSVKRTAHRLNASSRPIRYARQQKLKYRCPMDRYLLIDAPFPLRPNGIPLGLVAVMHWSVSVGTLSSRQQQRSTSRSKLCPSRSIVNVLGPLHPLLR